VRDLRFVVVGAYVVDCFVRAPRLPAWGEEYEVDSVRTSPGGKALNQAVALARLGVQVSAVGVVGGDGVGRDVVDALTREGIDASGIQQRDGVATAVCVCLVGETGETSILWHIDEDVAVTPDTVGAATAAIHGADAVLMTFEMPVESICETIRASRQAGAQVIVQPAPLLSDPSSAASLPWDQVDVLVPNETEARALLGGDRAGDMPADRLAEALADKLGVPTIAVTLGAAGCVTHSAGASRRYPAHEVVAVDTTGASDAFTATFAAYLAAGAAVPDAVDAAQAAAARAIQQEGGHESMPASRVAG
jgi:ribokinase